MNGRILIRCIPERSFRPGMGEIGSGKWEKDNFFFVRQLFTSRAGFLYVAVSSFLVVLQPIKRRSLPQGLRGKEQVIFFPRRIRDVGRPLQYFALVRNSIWPP